SGSYTQNGVGGVQTKRTGLGDSEVVEKIHGGLFDAFGQVFGYNYTGYSVGFTLSIPLSNKATQAEYARSLTTRQSVEARRNRLAQMIALEVRNAHSQVEMNRARIEAADKALQLSIMQLEAEHLAESVEETTVNFLDDLRIAQSGAFRLHASHAVLRVASANGKRRQQLVLVVLQIDVGVLKLQSEAPHFG